MTIAGDRWLDVSIRRGFSERARVIAMLWLRRIRTRQQLRVLDAAQLDDIGRSEAERRHECAKWFWQ
jgi:uncharacterized protein YjiS (DUF1127 family)